MLSFCCPITVRTVTGLVRSIQASGDLFVQAAVPNEIIIRKTLLHVRFFLVT
jgi:hypothetical protein